MVIFLAPVYWTPFKFVDNSFRAVFLGNAVELEIQAFRHNQWPFDFVVGG